MQSTKNSLDEDLQRFERYFYEALGSDIPLLNTILAYIARHKGKQLRILLVLFCARLGDVINEKSYRAALFAELLHTSSLVHDDVIDDASHRRSGYSVKMLWNNKAAVLTGNYPFMKSVQLLVAAEDYRILSIYAAAISQLVEGELRQLQQSKKPQIDEKVYYEIIRGKTASLLAACCSAGAASTFTDEPSIRKLHLFGEMLGMAFQIKDDLLDYGKADIGKPTGNDLKAKQLTLPLLYTLNNCLPSVRRRLLHIMRYENRDTKSIDCLREVVESHGGIAYATQKMLDFRQKALDLLYEFPESAARSAVGELALYITDRGT